MSEFADIDLDVLRGWREHRDPELRQAHKLPPLARLVSLDGEKVETIHGPDVLIGRYNPQYGPVDVILRDLQDHQNYRLGAPHLHLTLQSDSRWSLRSISPGTRTLVDGEEISQPNELCAIESGAELTIGCVRYRFETSGLALSAWEDARNRLLNGAAGPSLFLCRRGGPCGPRVALDEHGALVIGRSFPGRATLAGDHSWDGHCQPDWDLAGLYEEERKFIGFEHAHVDKSDRVWRLTPVTSRRRAFVNRLEIIDTTPLSSGDEVALGSVIFYLHEPGDAAPSERKAIEPPAVIDWQEGSAPILDEASEPQDDASSEGSE